VHKDDCEIQVHEKWILLNARVMIFLNV
jgi:hypothetical protein